MFIFLIYLLIGVLASASYITALRNVHRGHYRPNVFSRVVWALLGINSFAGVIFSKSTVPSIILTTVMMVGSILILIASIKNGKHSFGLLEKVCTLLLLISLAVWIFYDQPFLNVAISLIAHFIGALPTYRQVWKKPNSESRMFWGLFFLASLTSVVASYGQPALKQLVPVYYSIFDGSVFLLSIRKIKQEK